MNALVPRPQAEVMPTVHAFAAQLAAVNPLWGRFGADGSMPALPSRTVLEAMRDELAAHLVPCTLREAAIAAAAIIDGYPQRDASTATYAEHLTMRLALVPADLLPAVVAEVIDDNPDFRPGAGRVRIVAERTVGARRILLAKVEAALRWQEAQARAAAQHGGRPLPPVPDLRAKPENFAVEADEGSGRCPIAADPAEAAGGQIFPSRTASQPPVPAPRPGDRRISARRTNGHA
jgi:hypothetical protein